jgi:hypothetical protein
MTRESEVKTNGEAYVMEVSNRIKIYCVCCSYDEQGDFNTGAAISQPKERSSYLNLKVVR